MSKLQCINCNLHVMKKLKISKGSVYGRLTAIGEGEKITLPSGQINRTIKCECECGTIKDIRVLHLTRGRIKSCGCLVKTVNGESTTPISILYRSMKYRCSESYYESKNYFDRGIGVCKEWSDDFFKFKKFCIENGYKKGLQIDREDNEKGYSPDNCRFVRPKINVNNRRNTHYIEYKGKEESLQLLLERLNHPNKFYTVRARILRGWDIEKAIYQKPGDNYSARKTKN